MHNQDYALAKWREDASRDDPKFYSTATILDAPAVWMSIHGNVGWRFPFFENGEVIGISMVPWFDDKADFAIRNYEFRWVNPGQRLKIKRILSSPVVTMDKDSEVTPAE